MSKIFSWKNYNINYFQITKRGGENVTFTGLIILFCLQNSHLYSYAMVKVYFLWLIMVRVIMVTPCPKTLDTKTQLQQQTVANAAETINKKCNYFYINSNTRPIQEWMITQEHIRACVFQQYFLKRLFFLFFFPGPMSFPVSQARVRFSVRQPCLSPHRCSVLWCDPVPVPFNPALALQNIHEPVHIKRNEYEIN